MRRQDRALNVVAQRLVARRHVVEVPLGCAGRICFEHEHGALGQIVEQRGGAWRVAIGRAVAEEQRQVVLDALGNDAGAHVLVDAALAHVDIERPMPGIAETGDSSRVHGHFPRRQDAHLGNFGVGPLGVRIEQAQRVDFVVEQIDAHRTRSAHRKHVQQRPPNRELAALGNRVGSAVARRDQTLALGGDVERLPDFEQQRLALHEARRRQALQQGGGRHHQDAVRGLGQLEQRRQALGNDVLMRGEVVVGKDLPVRKREHGEIRPSEEANLVAYPSGPLGARGDIDDKLSGRGSHPRSRKAPGTAEEPLPVVQKAGRRGFQRGRMSHAAILPPAWRATRINPSVTGGRTSPPMTARGSRPRVETGRSGRWRRHSREAGARPRSAA